MVTQVPQGQIAAASQMPQNSPKYRSKTQGGNMKISQGRPGGAKGNKFSQFGMLGPPPEKSRGLKTLVLDLDETLVHS